MDSLVTIELTVLFGEVEKMYYIKSKDEETALSTIKNTLHGINMALSSPNDDKGTFYIEGNAIINLNKVSAVSADIIIT